MASPLQGTSEEMSDRTPLLLTLAALIALACLPACGNRNRSSDAASVLRVTSTVQHPDNRRPWLKKQPFTRTGLATVIEGGRLLVTADMVSHTTFIGLEKPEDGIKGSAVVETIDEECNLAVLRPVERELLDETHPLKLDINVRSGDALKILQLEPNGAPILSPATVTTVAVMGYPADGSAYLLYRTSATIPQKECSFVIPALHDGKLAGLVMRYDPKTQAADIIPAPLIARFLKESAKPGYRGLARAGLSWSEARGINLRSWLGAGDRQGVYVTSVEPGSPAENGGIRRGDLIVKVAGKTIDAEGNYSDPLHGKITFSNLASLESGPGDRMPIAYFRSLGEGTGTAGSATLTLSGRNPAAVVVPSRVKGETVPHVFLGGLLFQELSRPYLREWGSNWRNEAPQNLVYLDAFQDELPGSPKRIVILSAVLPSEQTMGLQDMANRVVTSVNGKEISSLGDVKDAISHPRGGFHEIILEGSSGPIHLEAANLGDEERKLRSHYGIPLESETGQGIH